MTLSSTSTHYEHAVALGSTYDAMRDVWWWINGSHPLVPNGIAWECVECWDGTLREVPVGGDMSNLSGGNLWFPSNPAPASLPQDAWAVFRNPGGAVAAQFQIFVKMEASSQASNSLISLDDWAVGGGTGAAPTIPATTLTQPPTGDGDGRFANQATFIWSVILDEGMFIMRMFDPAGGTTDSRWTYMGETDPTSTEADVPRPFITPRDTGINIWNGSFGYVCISPVDQSTVCEINASPYFVTTTGVTEYSDLGVEYICNGLYYALQPAGHRFTLGYARNLGCISQLVPDSRATCGFDGSDYRFEVWKINSSRGAVTRWPPGTPLAAGHTIITEESVPTQLVPAQGSGGGDGIPPEVTYVDPPPGAQISADRSITIDVTDDTGGFANIQLRVRYETDPIMPTESIYGGDTLGEFESCYESSTVVTITNGFRFVLVRDGGWPSSPTFVASPIDGSGNTT